MAYLRSLLTKTTKRSPLITSAVSFSYTTGAVNPNFHSHFRHLSPTKGFAASTYYRRVSILAITRRDYIRTLSRLYPDVDDTPLPPGYDLEHCTEEEARGKLYCVSTKHYYAFGAILTDNDPVEALKGHGGSFVGISRFIYGRGKQGLWRRTFYQREAVPYDTKYHKRWVNRMCKEEEEDNDAVAKKKKGKSK